MADEAVERLLRRLAGSRIGNPALLPALQLSGAQLPAVGGQSVSVLTLGNDDTIGGGVVVLRSPWAWATWSIEESRDSVNPIAHVARTGPFCYDVVEVSSACKVTATLARVWLPAVDPADVNELTGVVVTAAPNVAITRPSALKAVYLPGVRPSDLWRSSLSVYFADAVVAPIPADRGAIPVLATEVVAYPIDYFRRAEIWSSEIITFETVLPDGSAQATWPIVRTPNTAVGDALLPGAWAAIRMTNTGAAPANVSLAWLILP